MRTGSLVAKISMVSYLNLIKYRNRLLKLVSVRLNSKGYMKRQVKQPV